MKIILGAVISLPPFSPGIAWTWMHFAVGLRRLGHDVYYIEEVEPRWCVDDTGKPCAIERSVNRQCFRSIMHRFGLQDRAYQLVRGDDCLEAPGLRQLLRDSPDLLINMAGHVTSPRVLERVQRRAYFDQDPVYTQLWRSEYGKELNFSAHDVFVTVGMNIGTALTTTPDCNVSWHRALPPVVLDYWSVPVDTSVAFTTVASWGGFAELRFKDEWYKGKYEEFQRFATLPRRCEQKLEVALRWYPNEEHAVEMLQTNGWHVSNAADLATLCSYQQFVTASRAEIGIAKHAYVRANSGWFSDRSSHYLAAGRPVLAQSTGFEHCIPIGEGLLTFSTMEEAVEGIATINADYQFHAAAARALAEEYLDYRRVLPPLLDACMA